MKKLITTFCAIVLLAGWMATPAGAALNAVSPGVDPLNGFPIWYEDTNLLRLGQCLDKGAICAIPEAMAPIPANPLVFPTNFPIEFSYYMAVAKVTDPSITAVMVLNVAGSFLPAVNNPAVPGTQLVFNRIRIDLTPRVAAAANVPMTVTHPFGTITVTTRGVGQRLLVTQDTGLAPGIFTGALLDSPAGGIVNATGVSIGPFLTAAPPAPARVVVAGNTYLSDGVSFVGLNPGPGGSAFTVVGPAGSGVNINQATWTLNGKVSGCVAGSTPPVAVADPGAAAAAGAAQVINVTANDTAGATPAVPGPATPVPIDKASIKITVAPANGTATPNQDGTVTFTPNPTFVGTDGFTYTVADNCGNVSNAMAVPVVVENLTVDRAEFRAKTGKWEVTGQSSAAAGSTMTIFKGAGPVVPGTTPVIGTTTVKADGTYKFVGKSKTPPASPAQPQSVSAQSAATVTRVKVMKVQ